MPGTDSNDQDDSGGNELVDLPIQRPPDEENQIQVHREPRMQGGMQLQSNGDEHDPTHNTSPDQEARLWADLKAETGYDRYVDNLRAYRDRKGYAPMLYLGFLRRPQPNSNNTSPCECAIYDVYPINNCCPRISLQCGSSSGTKILSAIRQPFPAVTVRIVLWELWRDELRDFTLFDALGLGLRIQPRFFHALLANDTHTAPMLTFMDRPLPSELFVIDQYVVTIARNYLPANPDATPVILIARRGLEKLRFAREFDGIVPFQRLPTDEPRKPVTRLPPWMLQYVRLLESDFKKEREYAGNFNDLFLRSLAPLLRFNMSRIREEHDSLRKEYLELIGPPEKGEERISDHEKGLGKLFKMRSSLRRLIEDSEDKSEKLQRALRAQMANEVRQSTSLTTIEDELRRARLLALRWETEVRDYLQLQTGELARQESKKSIDLSNFQIEEAKRVKIFTILAFVYIPLNLATSIFGMNIEQLNGNGQHLHVFIITALVALVVTGGSWFVIEQVNSYNKWRRTNGERQHNRKTQFSLAVRFALIISLVLHRHSRWMFKSGTWWRLIVNHGSRLNDAWGIQDGTSTAGEYVSLCIAKHRKGGYTDIYFDSKRAEDYRWTSAREKLNDEVQAASHY